MTQIKFSLKKIFPYSILLIAVMLLSGCSSDSRKKIVIYSPHGKEMLMKFEELFEKENPGIDVQWLDMGSQEVYDRINTEKENSQADIWWGAPATIFMKAEKQGLLEQYVPSWAESVAPSHKSKDGYWFGTFITPEVIAFNKNVFTESSSAPRDWNSIISPEWKDKIVLRNPMASGTLRVIFCAMIAQSIAETGNEEQGWEWLRKLNENTVSYAADPTQMYLKLASEESPITLWNMPDIILQETKYSYPFGYVFPSSGTVVLTDGIAIIKGTKNSKEAKKFYEFVTSKESLVMQSEEFYRIPARSDIPKEKLPAWLRDADFKEMPLDWELISENESAWMKKWDTEVKSK